MACLLIHIAAAIEKIRPSQWHSIAWCPRHAPAWALIIALLSGCGTVVATPEPSELRLAASSSALALAQTLATAYHQAYPEVTVGLVPTANSLAAAHQVAVGNVDAALLTDPNPQSDPVPPYTDQVAWDSLVFVVHPSNGLNSLTREEALAIFRGQVREWPRRARTVGTIQILSREEGSGLQAAFEDQVMGGRTVARTALVMPGNKELRETVADTPQAIGYLPKSWLDESIKAVAVDGIDPSAEAMQASDYPLHFPIYVLTPEKSSGVAERFRDFILAAEGQTALGENALSWQKE